MIFLKKISIMMKEQKVSQRTKYRQMTAELDELGFVVFINRIHPKCWNYVVNGEILKIYKQRRSCNRQIQKLYTIQKNNKNE